MRERTIARTIVFTAYIAISVASCPGQEPYKDTALDVTFPAKIGTLELRSREKYPQPELGYSLRYDDADLFKVDIYVYDKKLSDIGNGVESKRVKQEFESLIGVFELMEKAGKYKDVRQLGKGTSSFPKGSLQFLWSRCQYRQVPEEGVTYTGLRISETYLSAKAGLFIKVRLTVKEEDFKSRQNEITGFMKELASILGAPKESAVR